MEKRKYDLIVMGATGFTGKLVAEYLYRQYGCDGKLSWGVAGRNASKLEQLTRELRCPELAVIVADSKNDASLQKLAGMTTSVITTVGPYALYGSALVDACVHQGTHYCDLSGEVQWMRKMIDRYHKKAEENRVKIVHSCGFDSIPSDMGVYFLQKEAKERFGSFCQQIKFRLKAAKGGFSGGTYASLTNVMKEAGEDPQVWEVLKDPYSLNPEGMRQGKDMPDLNTVVYDPDLQTWITPFVMSSINTRIVRRSHALSGFPYGQDFRYDEAIMTGGGFSGRIKAYSSAAAMGLLTAAKPGSIMKKVVDRFLPDPGEGPDKEKRDAGFFNIFFWGKTASGSVIKCKVTGDKDPGYGSTSKMLGESGVCLAMEGVDHPGQYGVITPSVAMGDALLTRLQQNAGLKFEILD